VLAAFGASAQDTSRNSNPNPFQRPTAAAPATGVAATTSSAASVHAASSAAPTAQEPGPLALPPPIPLPPPGIAYPALSMPKMPAALAAPVTKVLPPLVPPLDEESAKLEGKPAKSGKAENKSEADVPAKPRAFLAREKIEANRARCQVSFKGRTLVQLPAGETDQVLQLTGADGCLTAMSADTDWLDVQYAGNNELVVSATANEEDTSRRGQITVVTPKQTFVLTVRQAAPAPVRAVTVTPAAGVAVAPAPRAEAPVKTRALVSTQEPTNAAPVKAADKGIDKAADKVAEPVKAEPEKVAPAPAPVVPAVPAEPELSEAALARMADAPVAAPAKFMLDRLREPVTPVVTVAPVVPMALPVFDLPEIKESPRLIVPRVMPELTISLVEPTHLPMPSVLSLALPDVKPMPALAPAAPVVAPTPVQVAPVAVAAAQVPAAPAKSLAAPQEKAVAVLPSAAKAPAAPEPIAPKTVEYRASAHVVEDEPVAQPAPDPARARSVLQAMLGVQVPVSKAATRTPAAPAVKGKPAMPSQAAPVEKKVPAVVNQAPAKSLSVPEGYVTLDEYDSAGTSTARK